MAKENKYVQFCPICASKKFVLFREDKATEISDLSMFKCKRCQNVFAFPLELPLREASKLKEVPLTKEILKDTPESAYIPMGEIEINVYWKFLGAFMSLFGISYIIATLWPVNCHITNSIKTCAEPILPSNYIFFGLAILAAGMYLALESYALNHKSYKQTKLFKIGIILALLIIMIFFGWGSLNLFYLP
ncbi:MAG: hypothetical protein WCI04_05495 [archaeon]